MVGISGVTDQPAARLTVAALGVRWPHDPGYTVERPHGLGMYLLVHFRSPMTAFTSEALVSAEPGDCLLYEPSFPQWYRGREAGFIDDWLHVYGRGMPELIRRRRIPVNTVFRPRDTEFITPILEAINQEMRRGERDWQEAVRLLVESLFLQLGRQLSPAGVSPADRAWEEALRNLRMEVHERMQEPWSVEAMARLVNLSRARFATLYTKLLGTSPMEDLIHARLRHARALLTNAAMSVAEAAEQSGFGSVCHFSRLFRKHVGCSPRDFRRFPLAHEVDVSEAADGKSRTSLLLEHSDLTHGWQVLTGRDLEEYGGPTGRALEPGHANAAARRPRRGRAGTRHT
jgi:AraC-like DNA-binding protein